MGGPARAVLLVAAAACVARISEAALQAAQGRQSVGYDTYLQLSKQHLLPHETYNEALDHELAALPPPMLSQHRGLQAASALLGVDDLLPAAYQNAWNAKLNPLHADFDPGLGVDPSGGYSTLSALCNDPLASNYMAPDQTACTYDCETLKTVYFDEPVSKPADKTRCFVYQGGSGLWEESTTNLNMMTLKKAYTDWNIDFEGTTSRDRTLLSPTTSGAGSFPILASSIPAIAGFAADNTSCTKVLLRVDTTAVSGDVAWTLDAGDGRAPEPWNPGSGTTAGVGLADHFACVYDNNITVSNYTLSRSGAGASSWAGTVSVLAYVYDNTIYVPDDENWVSPQHP